MKRNISLLVLGVVSIGLSRATFFFVNDPEGPNLLVVAGLAVIIFAVLCAIYAAVRRINRKA
jgi:hypothetical protein